MSPHDLRKVFEAAVGASPTTNSLALPCWNAYSMNIEDIFHTHRFNQSWAGAAPVLILGTANTKFSHNGTDNRNALYDLEQPPLSHAASCRAGLTLTRWRLRPGRRRQPLKSQRITPRAVIVSAIRANPPLDQHDLIAQETLRTRKPLNEFVLSFWASLQFGLICPGKVFQVTARLPR